MNLNPHTLAALEHKATVASDSYDAYDENTHTWADVFRRCKVVTVLQANRVAMEELENYLGGEMSPGERRAIQADLCRAGWYDRHHPDSVSTRRLKTLLVDGKRYVVG